MSESAVAILEYSCQDSDILMYSQALRNWDGRIAWAAELESGLGKTKIPV